MDDFWGVVMTSASLELLVLDGELLKLQMSSFLSSKRDISLMLCRGDLSNGNFREYYSHSGHVAGGPGGEGKITMAKL